MNEEATNKRQRYLNTVYDTIHKYNQEKGEGVQPLALKYNILGQMGMEEKEFKDIMEALFQMQWVKRRSELLWAAKPQQTIEVITYKKEN